MILTPSSHAVLNNGCSVCSRVFGPLQRSLRATLVLVAYYSCWWHTCRSPGHLLSSHCLPWIIRGRSFFLACWPPPARSSSRPRADRCAHTHRPVPSLLAAGFQPFCLSGYPWTSVSSACFCMFVTCPRHSTASEKNGRKLRQWSRPEPLFRLVPMRRSTFKNFRSFRLQAAGKMGRSK